MPVDRVLADFAGSWTLERTIRPTTGPSARFSGVAEWVWQGETLAYAEVGTLQMEGTAPMQAERRYLWAPGLQVFFDDGRFFHTVPAAGGDASHWCAPDMYRVHYDFSGWPAFHALWQVAGPRKSYEMSNHYEKRDI